jgi:hypothetical protein
MLATNEAPDLASVIRSLELAPYYNAQIVERGITEPRAARHQTPERRLREPLMDKLREAGLGDRPGDGGK